jgi:hypothetical protein
MGSIGGMLFDPPLLVLTNAQEGIGRKSISIGSGIFLSVSLVTSLNTLGEALSKIIVLTGGSLVTDGRVTQNFWKKNWDVIIPTKGINYFSGGFSHLFVCFIH